MKSQVCLLSFFCVLCFPWSIIPFPGIVIRPFLELLNSFWIPILGPNCKLIYSDSLGMKVSFFHAFCFTSFILFIFRTKIEKYSGQIQFWTSTCLTYLLVFFLLKYGIDKVFKAQFPFPESNILYTPIGMVSKGLLYWSSVGSSYSFNVATGLVECFIGVLIIWRKTRIAGLLLSFFAMCNIVLINFSFDIDVKVLSSLLLATSIVLLIPCKERIFSLLNADKTNVILPSTLNLDLPKPKYFQWKIIVLMLLSFDILSPYFESNNFNADIKPKSSMVGAYRIIGNVDSLLSVSQPVYCFVNSRGYLIVQNADYEKISVPSKVLDTKLITLDSKLILEEKNNHFEIVNGSQKIKLRKLKNWNLILTK